jgi:hypothetical protein
MRKVTGLSSTLSRIILRENKWNVDSAISQFLTNSKELSKKLGLSFEKTVDEKDEEITECPICFDDIDDNSKLDCKHSYCRDCLQEHVRVGVQSGKNFISCPSKECSQVLDEMIVLDLIKDNKTKKMFAKR